MNIMLKEKLIQKIITVATGYNEPFILKGLVQYIMSSIYKTYVIY